MAFKDEALRQLSNGMEAAKTNADSCLYSLFLATQRVNPYDIPIDELRQFHDLIAQAFQLHDAIQDTQRRFTSEQ